MRYRIKEIRNTILSTLLLLIMGGIIVNSTFFLHAHKINNGKIIFHAHPYRKNAENSQPLSNHQHSSAEFVVIANSSVLIENSSEIIIEPFYNFVSQLYIELTEFNTSLFFTSKKSRGPPAYLFLI